MSGHPEQEAQVFREMVKAYKRESSNGITDEELFTKLSQVLETASKEALKTPAAGGDTCTTLDHSSSSMLSFTCPTRRFGRTELQMPIISCGGVSES